MNFRVCQLVIYAELKNLQYLTLLWVGCPLSAENQWKDQVPSLPSQYS